MAETELAKTTRRKTMLDAREKITRQKAAAIAALQNLKTSYAELMASVPIDGSELEVEAHKQQSIIDINAILI